MSRSAKRSPGSESPAMQHPQHTSRRRSAPTKSPQSETIHNRLSSKDSPAVRNSKTPSPTFMFVPMSSEPGKRARVQPGLRASAKAHVMHDYQRRTAEKRLAQWKTSTPTTYSLAPKETSLDATVIQVPTSLPQEIVGWETVVFQKQEQEPKADHPPAGRPSSKRAGHLSRRNSSPLVPQNTLMTLFSQNTTSTIVTQPHDTNSVDVFGILPVRLQPWDETLIDRWLNYDRIPWCPVNGQSQWIPFVTNSSMLLHTNLYCWGMHWHGKLTGIDQNIFLTQNPQILEHKIAAIQMINAYLESQIAITDQVLASVAIFINVSLQFFNRTEAASHMAGLETLIRLRGGLESLSSMGTVGVLLQRMITWNDLFYVELFGGDLRFSVLPRWDEAWQAVYEPLVDDPVTHLEPLQARFAGNLAQEITTILREMRVVCTDLKARPLSTLTTAEKTLRHDNLLRFERRLCLATRITTISAHGDPHEKDHDPMWRAVAIAALMYVHHHMRPGYALHLAQFRALSIQLRGELSLTNAQSWDAVPAIHLWVLTVGSWVSQRENWILDMLATACRVRGCVSWDMFERVLGFCPSLGTTDQEKFRIIWSDVANLL